MRKLITRVVDFVDDNPGLLLAILSLLAIVGIFLVFAAPAPAQQPLPVVACPMPQDDETPPNQPAPPPAKKHCPLFSFQQLPPENICKACWEQANKDVWEINQRLEFVWDYRGRQDLLAARSEANRVQAIWWATWNCVWPQAEKRYRQEWTDILVDMIGHETFWTGVLPLPLSLR